jgi:hypothetical protein
MAGFILTLDAPSESLSVKLSTSLPGAAKGLPVLSACLILSYLVCRVLHELVTTRRERIGRGFQKERAAHDKPAFVEEGKQVDIKTDGKLGRTFGQRTVRQRQLGLVKQLLLFPIDTRTVPSCTRAC